MRQVWITRAGPPEVLRVREAPDPACGPGQVRIRARACGINFADIMARLGVYPDAPRIPCVVGYEISGLVDQVGPGVRGFAPGERVIGMPYFGGYSDTVVLPALQVFKMPAAMSFEEGAALPVVYLTAHHMLRVVARLREGGKVLIHSAAGGVGLAAVELARAQRCTIFGSASPAKHEFLRQRGVTHPLDSGRDVAAAVRAILGPQGGLDVILDPVGGRSWTEGYRLLGDCGHLVAFGFAAAVTGKRRNLPRMVAEFLRIKKISPLQLMSDNRSVSGVNIAHLFHRFDLLGAQFASLLALYEAGQIKPYVDRTFPFDQAAAAHDYLQDRKAKGKVLLVP